MAAGQFGGLLYPTEDVLPHSPLTAGQVADLGETNQSFGLAIEAWNQHRYKNAYRLFGEHVQAFPNSPWVSEALLHQGCEARYEGPMNEAEQTYLDIIAVNQGKTAGGCCGIPAPDDNPGDDDQPPPPPDPPCNTCPCPGDGKGQPVWKVNPITMNFYMKDIPLWYNSAKAAGHCIVPTLCVTAIKLRNCYVVIPAGIAGIHAHGGECLGWPCAKIKPRCNLQVAIHGTGYRQSLPV